MQAEHMEFLCWYSESEECLELPVSFKNALSKNIPEYILVTVGFQEYRFNVKSNKQGQWVIDGKAWEQYVIHRDVQPETYLHLILMEDGPIYLIHYNKFGVSMIHPKKTPRAMAREINHSPEYVEIHKQWFKLISYEKKETNQIFIEGSVYDVQIYYKEGMPNGFYGQGWAKIYAELQIRHDEAIVFLELSPNVFTLSVFDHWEGKRTPTPKSTAAIFSHNKIIYSNELDLVMFEHRKDNTFAIGASTANGITEFDKEIDEDLIKRRYLTVPKPIVREIPADEVHHCSC